MEEPFNIMLIEDDVALRENMIKLLNKYGYIGIGTEDFRNVQGEVERINPKLILLDINLPYSDGFYFITYFIPCFLIMSSSFRVPCIQICPLKRRPGCGSPKRSLLLMQTTNSRSWLSIFIR